MLIIDYLDEANMPAEKPNHRIQPVIAQPVVAQRFVFRKGPGIIDPLYRWAQDQQESLLQAAHNARLIKLAKDGREDQKRKSEKTG